MKNEEEAVSYEIIRSGRKTMAIQIRKDGSVVVRCPQRVSDGQVQDFVRDHEEWIRLHRREVLRRIRERVVYTEEQVKMYRRHAGWLLARKTWEWAQKMEVSYGRITIRDQSTRWGSCSAGGNLNYNWRLVLVPEDLLDYVVVHELAHRKEMNHSPGFWKLVEEQLPDYRERRKRLRDYENGQKG